MIQVKNVKKSFGKHEVIQNINFSIEAGEIYGFLGPNGAGKTTTMNMLTGLLPLDAGQVYIDGMELSQDHEKIEKIIGYLPEDPQFYPYMTGQEYLTYIGKISRMKAGEIQERNNSLLHLVDLIEAGDRRIGGYSRGMRQRLGLAVAVYNHPKILFLDEPSSALDPQGRRELLDIILKLKDDNTTVFLSTHILSDVERVCDRIAILHEGIIHLEDSIENLQEQYLQPIYEIQWEGDCTPLKEQLKKAQWLEKIHTDKNRMTLYVKDRKKSQRQIFEAFSKIELPMISMGLKRSTLEDIFVKVVNNK